MKVTNLAGTASRILPTTMYRDTTILRSHAPETESVQVVRQKGFGFLDRDFFDTDTAHAAEFFDCAGYELTGCNAYGRGQTEPGRGYGFLANYGHGVTMTDCTASNFRNGFVLASVTSAVLTRCTASECSVSGFSIRNGSTDIELFRCSADVLRVGNTDWPDGAGDVHVRGGEFVTVEVQGPVNNLLLSVVNIQRGLHLCQFIYDGMMLAPYVGVVGDLPPDVHFYTLCNGERVRGLPFYGQLVHNGEIITPKEVAWTGNLASQAGQ